MGTKTLGTNETAVRSGMLRAVAKLIVITDTTDSNVRNIEEHFDVTRMCDFDEISDDEEAEMVQQWPHSLSRHRVMDYGNLERSKIKECLEHFFTASAAVSRWHLLGGLLLLLLLLLGICVLLWFCFSDFLNWGRLFNLGLLLDGNEQANDVLGLDHVVLIDLELTEDVVNLSLGHLVSPGLEGVLEHLGVNLALVVVGLESLDDEVVGVVALAGHLLLEHLDHVVVGARSRDLSQQTVELGLAHEHTDVVEGSAQVVLVQLAILVDVHQLEAVLVHLQLLLGESALILTLAHPGGCVVL